MIDLNATLLIQIFNFLLLVALLTKFAYKPLMSMLAEREQRIAGSLEAAEQERQEAAKLKEEYLKELAAARNQDQQIVEKANRLAEQNKEDLLQAAKEEHARLLKATQEELAREREKALQDLRSEVVALSVAAAGKILSQNLDAAAHAQLVDDFIEKLEHEKTGGLPC